MKANFEMIRKLKEGKCLLHNLDCHYVNGKVDLDHFKTRGSGGGNETWNLMPLCRYHHQERHRKQRIDMYRKYWQYKDWCDFNGWEYCPVLLKWSRK